MCAVAIEIRNAFVNDLGDECFAILVDESRHVSTKKHMTIVLRYIDKYGHVIERFLRILHVNEHQCHNIEGDN